MSVLIPCRHERLQALRQMRQIGEVGEAQPLALQNGEPLFYLVHPRTVDGREVAAEARMGGQPGPHQGAGVHAHVVHHQMDRRDGRGDLLIELLQEGDELALAAARRGGRIDMTAACVKGGEEIERPTTLVFVLDAHRLPAARRTRPPARTT